MILPLPHTRRQKRLFATGALAVTFVAAVTTALLLVRRAPADYVPGEKVEGLTESLSRKIPKEYPGVTFADVTEQAGIRFTHFSGKRSSQLPEDMGSGAAWEDYDGDGWPDLFLANEAGPLTLSESERKQSPARCALYRNNGDGTFADVTDAAGLGGLRGELFMGAAWGDYDNDGNPDLYVTAYGRNRLLRSDGKGRFTDVTARTKTGGLSGFWAGASWGDFDRDGNLDLYVCGYVKYHEPRPEELSAVTEQAQSTDVPFTLNPSSYPAERNLLYRNNGDGTFTEVAKKLGVDNPDGRSLSAAWCDFDADGWPDLYVNNDVSMHAFYRNTGKGKPFEDIGVSSLACDYRGGMGIAVGDWDNNADMDMFLTHWVAQENALYHNMLSQTPPAPADAHDKKAAPKRRLMFMDISDQVGLGQSSLDYVGWGTAFLDFDNDTRLDLAIANGHTLEEREDRTRLVPMRNQLFWNGNRQAGGFMEGGGGDKGFFEVQDAAGEAWKQPNVGRGLAAADFDRDGAIDMVITRNIGPPLLLKNASREKRSWLLLQVRGRSGSSRDAVGARVTLSAGGIRQARIVGASSSYLSQDERVLHFGLGNSESVDSLEVWWPSGRTQKFRNLPARRFLRLEEGGQIEPVKLHQSGKGVQP